MQSEDLNLIAIEQSDSTVYTPALHGLVISAAGTIVIRNEIGDLVTVVIPAAVTDETVTALPFVLPGRVRQVMNTNTTIGNSAIHGLSRGSKVE